ncbi:MAG: hypothetical protein Q4P66_09830, partial [Actinomycetaceae bacterium]|nr:hypothetical protein [Actinomycetaceae bacterium]
MIVAGYICLGLVSLYYLVRLYLYRRAAGDIAQAAIVRENNPDDLTVEQRVYFFGRFILLPFAVAPVLFALMLSSMLDSVTTMNDIFIFSAMVGVPILSIYSTYIFLHAYTRAAQRKVQEKQEQEM